MVDLRVSKLSQEDVGFDLVEYRDRYPYQIDQNLNIFANHELYLNCAKQVFNLLEDLPKIMKLREQNPEFMADLDQFLFAKQILTNQFNVVLSLVS